MLTIFLTIIASFCAILWTLIFVPFILFGIKIHKITNQVLVINISKKIVNNSTMIEDNSPLGFFCGIFFAGYIHEHRSERRTSTEIYLLSSKKVYDQLTTSLSANSENINADIKITLYERNGNFFDLKYLKRELSISKIIANESQKKIVDEIISAYKSGIRVVTAYIYGKPGTGKSTIPIIIAQELSGSSLCKSFNPTEPGDTIQMLYNYVSPTKECPLILVLEEIDNIIYVIHDGIMGHKYIPIQVKNKTGWTSLFDDIHICYPFMIVILTSNISYEAIDAKDKCYLRKGRINYRYNMD